MAEQRHGHAHGAHGTSAGEASEAGGQIQVGILTCSDRASRGERADVGGPTIHNLVVERLGAKVAQYKVVPDERGPIESTLVEWADELRLDLILTTGGTGFSPRDVTPEATRAVIEREAPALTQAMLFESLRITPYAMLTRATAGIRTRTLIVNLPGTPKAVTENFDAVAEVLPHAVDIVRGVDTHAARSAHGGHGAHGGHREEGGHGGHRDHGESEGGHRHRQGHDHEAASAGDAAVAPRSGGIARNVGGPPC
jgi:molybdopterin adenylyltransferase